ncbi:type 1 glutamine amidotransferase [Porticoccus sp.]
MHIHYLQHVPFEGLGSMEHWFQQRGYNISATHLYRNESLPALDNIDWLIVMGGPMGVSDERQYSWLSEEKAFIDRAIKEGKTILGVCLGAQLIADVLGAPVTKNPRREIGWFPLTISEQAKNTTIGKALQAGTEAFHWHGDTFAIPAGALLLASSDACKNQGFIYNHRVVGFQFHLETTYQSARDLTTHCADELDGSLYVQSAQQILEKSDRFDQVNQVMSNVLGCLEQICTATD